MYSQRSLPPILKISKRDKQKNCTFGKLRGAFHSDVYSNKQDLHNKQNKQNLHNNLHNNKLYNNLRSLPFVLAWSSPHYEMEHEANRTTPTYKNTKKQKQSIALANRRCHYPLEFLSTGLETLVLIVAFALKRVT